MGIVDFSGINYIDSLLWHGRKWGSGNTGTGANITYNFADINTPSDVQQARIRDALDDWAEIANITFTLVSGTGDITFFAKGGQARPDLNDSGINHVDVDVPANTSYDYGSYEYGAVVLHEIGHALGLKHPHDTGDNGFDVIADLSIDAINFSVMSYRSYVGQPTAGPYIQNFYPTTPMLHDIAAIQHIYGANINTRTGNDIYKWLPGQQILETIWDAGGIDTIDWSNQSSDAEINLNPGAWSKLGPAYQVAENLYKWNRNIRTDIKNTLAIAYGVTIENAKGGSGNDAILGNPFDNSLNGLNGNDRVYGSDLLIGGKDRDIITGGEGADTFRFNSLDGIIDTITDFSAVTGDKIEISSSFGGGITVGVLDASQFTIGSAASSTDHRIIYDDRTGGLFFDVDGIGGENQIQFAILAELTNYDIFVI